MHDHFLFRLQYNCQLFSRQIFKIVNVWVNNSLIFWFCFAGKIFQSLGTLPSEITKYLIEGWMICTQAYGLFKKATRPSRQFLVAPAPISLQFLCPHLPLLLCALNQNHHATQATKEAIGEWVKKNNVQNVILLHTFRRLTVLKDETSSFDSAYNNYYFFLLQVRDFPVNQTKMGSLTMRHSGFTDMHFWNSQYHNSRCGL